MTSCYARYVSMVLFTAGILTAADPTTLLENDQVRVIKVTDQPHAKTAPHEHKSNRVMIYLQPGAQQIQNDKGGTLLKWRAGEVKWSPASGVHTSEVVSNPPVTIIEAEIKKGGDAAHKGTTPRDPMKVGTHT